jgi:hypothetical protein
MNSTLYIPQIMEPYLVLFVVHLSDTPFEHAAIGDGSCGRASKLAPSCPDVYELHRMDLPTSLPNLNPIEDFGLCSRTASKIEQDTK